MQSNEILALGCLSGHNTLEYTTQEQTFPNVWFPIYTEWGSKKNCLLVDTSCNYIFKTGTSGYSKGLPGSILEPALQKYTAEGYHERVQNREDFSEVN